MRRLGIYEKAPSKSQKSTCTRSAIAKYPGERVTNRCKICSKRMYEQRATRIRRKYYQYTAIDEYTRLRYTYYCKEHNTYESTIFVNKLIRYFPFKIKIIQTDNGFEFTNRLSWNGFNKNKKTMFEKRLKELKIEHSLIRPHTPTQNGKVERSHRKDQERFYYKRVFVSLEDLKEKGKRWLIEYNNFPMRPLKWMSPKEKLLEYMAK